MAVVGLQFDLSAWRSGIRNAATLVKKGIGPGLLTPFDRAMKRSIAGIRSGFSRVGGFLKGMLSSALAPILAIFAAGAVFATVKKIITESVKAYEAYADSVSTLQAALRSVGETDISGATAGVKDLADKLRMTMGIMSGETNAAFGDFLTRGFDQRQARQLTILAANYAKKSGKPLAEVAKTMADAANGSVKAMKALGVEVAATGNRVADGEAAVRALKAAYGDIGGDLADPSERLSAAWNELAIAFGERIYPVIEPIVQGISDFVTGLTQTEEGKEMLDQVAEAVKFVVEWLKQAIITVSNLVDMVTSGGAMIKNVIRIYLSQMLKMWLDMLGSLPGGDFLMEQLGIDRENLSKGFQEESENAAKDLIAASGEFKKAWDNYSRGADDVGLAGKFNEIREAGKAAREEAAKSLNQEMAATKGETFAGNPAWQAELAKQEKARQAAIEKNNKRLSGYAEAGAGQDVSVRIVNRRADRFRKARSR